MCLAVPAKIISLELNEALVDMDGVNAKVDVSIIEEPKIGDYVLIHSGIAIQKYDEDEAKKTLELIREIAKVND
ncbi:hydrogenase assembly protein HupF [bacterium B13(2017)]|nr:hydrogenase assembly protein HupF [bacterium B13(2017)]